MAQTTEGIVSRLRRQIHDGTYPPGSRLPTRSRLEREFDTSSHTIQRALNELAAEGYVEARKWAGTFVTANPPHLSRICLFAPMSLRREVETNRFFRSILDELEVVEQQLGVTFEVLDAASDFRNQGRIQRLVEDVRLQRLAGILFLAIPGNFVGTPIYDDPEIARVAISNASRYGIPAVCTDDLQFYTRALEYLSARGCRRPAVIADPLTAMRPTDLFPRWFARFGLTYRPELVQSPEFDSERAFRNLLRLYFRLPVRLRPDALIVGDDNQLEVIASELRALNWLSGPEPRVVVLANFPHLVPVSLPVIRLGYETDRTLELCTRSILAQNRGEQVPLLTTLPARFEFELSERSEVSPYSTIQQEAL